VIDELDQKLILELQKDGRQSNNDLGKKLFVNEGTIRKRLKKLESEKIIRVVAIPSLVELGYNSLSIVAIQVDMAHVNEVAAELGKKDSVCQVAFVTGRYDLIAIVACHSTEEFSRFMRQELSVIPHIARTETFVVLSLTKGAIGLTETAQLVKALSCPHQKIQRNK
jgi:Lrp/AsnC family transcriptional regulator, regulator for asnA, asnC and gidA